MRIQPEKGRVPVHDDAELPPLVTTDEPRLMRKPVAEVDRTVKGAIFWGMARIAIGFVFLWAFIDKTFGLGFATGRNAETGAIDFGAGAWINGGSPTEVFLTTRTKGPFKGFFEGLAGSAWVDWVFMASILLIGLGLMFGIASRLAAVGGVIWMGLFYAAGSIWPASNPVIDQHVVYAIVLLGIATVGAGRYLGFGRWWERTTLVQKFPVLR